MPSRKQRQRKIKSKRHQYETVWLDADGNELDEAPSELVEQEEQKKKDKAVATTSKGASQQRGGRATRQPPVPSWNRAFKRAALLGLVVFFLFSLTSKSSNRYLAALIPAVIYTAMFIPLTFFIDRFAYRRWQVKQAGGAATPQRPAAKKR
jgi:hypothetical protein